MAKPKKQTEAYIASTTLAVFLLLANAFLFHTGVVDLAVVVILLLNAHWLKTNSR